MCKEPFRAILTAVTLVITLFSAMPRAAVAVPETGQEEKTSLLREFFSDLLLIIHFNHPHYENIDFLKEIYSPFFSNIVFYGTEAAEGVIAIDSYQGWFIHRVMKDALARFPGYRGYLCAQDDCFIGFWNLLKMDKDRIWFHYCWSASLQDKDHPWPWWHAECGARALRMAYQRLPSFCRKNLQKNFGERRLPYSWADFFYLPAVHRRHYFYICDAFDEPDVFLELAIPTILCSLAPLEEIEQLNPYWGGTACNANLNLYDQSIHWVHPIKFSFPEMREWARQTVAEALLAD